MATQQHEGAYQKPSVVSLPVKLSGRCVPDGGRGRISKDGTFLWLYDDTQLEVYAVATGQKISSWAHKSVKISCACELPMKSGPSFLVMGMRVDESVNVVATFSPALSQVVRAVQVEHAVSTLLAVSSTNLESNGLFSQCVLTGFTGIVAVGCHGGGVLLLDLALHSEHMKASRSRGVNEPIGSHAISPKEGLAVQLEGGLHSHLHTCVDLTVDYRFTSVFKYVSSSKKLLKQFSGAEVVVTALHYVPQINSLLVGFNFGSFQIYNLTDLSLDHSNPYSKISAPVVDFIYQEPENDPKNLVFVWVAQGPSEFACSLSPMKYSNIALYQLLYEDKLKCGGPGGHVFSNFKGCIGRFDHFLSAEPTSSDSLASVDSRLVRCATLERLHQGCDDASEDHALDLTLAVFVWSTGRGADAVNYVGLFDLNQWYFSQLPRKCRWRQSGRQSGVLGCSYFSFFSLDLALSGEKLMDAFVFDVSLFSVATVAEEEHFWPSADAFGVYCLCSESVNMCKFFGLQRTVLRELCSCGSFAFSEPQHFLSDCATAMLGPTSSLDQSVQPSDIAFQKKALLSVALEYGLQSVCTSCANSWISEGGIVLLIDWIELKIAELVLEKDKLWKHLLSANPLELSEIHVGHKLISSMEQVACILDTVIVLSQKTSADLDYSKLVLQLRFVTVQCRVLKVMMWFVKKKILPFMLDFFNEPSELSSLSKCYSALRHSAEHHGLAVDYLYSELMDMPLQEDQSSGYPPSSVDHFVMLLSGLNTTPQHCIMVYFLCDMAKLQEQENVIEFASSYVMEFGIPPHLSAMAFGLWCLDNRNFEDSLNYLLSSAAVRLFPWQHFAILWALLHAEHFRGAVRYIQAHCNDLSSVEDSLLMVNVLIASGCVSTAFQVVCKNEDASLLTHFLEQCLLGGKLHSVLQLPMDLFHQELVCTFLEQQSSVDAQLMLVAFCLQNSRHAQAMHAYEKVKPMAKTSHDPRIRQQFKLLSSLLSGYFSVLPKPLQSVVSHPVTELPPALSPTVKPLTTVVREGSREMSKVDLIHAVMENTSKAIRSEIMETPSPFRKREAEYLNEVPYTPFISTPASTRKAKRFCTHTPKTSEKSSVMGVTDSVVPLDNSITKLKRHMQCFKDRISVLDHRSMAFDVSVFKTPLLEKVTQKTPSQGKEEAEPPSAPHSILKVKQEDMDTTACMDLTDVRPDEARQSVPRKIRFAVEGNLIPSPVSPATEKGLQVQALSLITPLPHDSSEEFLSPAESPSQLSPVATTHDIKLSSEKLFSEFKNPTPIQTGDEGFSKVQDTALSSDSKDDDKHSFIAAAAEDKKKKKKTENILPRKELWVKKELTSESERVKQEVKEHYSLRTLRKGDDSGASSSVFTVPPVTTTHSTQLHVPTPASKKKKVPSHSLLTPVVKLDMSKQGTSLAERKAKILNVNEASVTSTVSTVGGQPSATMANPQRSQRLKTLRPRNPTKKVFSDPVPLAAPSTRHKEESVSTPKTTPFVFSPPLTRSRAKVPATDYSNSSKVVATPSTRGRAMREASGQPDTAATSESTPQQLASVSRRNQAVVKSVKSSASSTAARRSTRLLRNKK